MKMKSIGSSFKDDYLFQLTDDTGIFQHSKYGVPDRRFGYTTDDNARALIMALMLYKKYKKKVYMQLVYRFSAFILHAQNSEGRFRNFMTYEKIWLEEEGSEDCFGRCLWALGYGITDSEIPACIKRTLQSIMKKAIPHVLSLVSPRGKAYSVIGLAYLNNDESKGLISEAVGALYDQYYQYRDGKWKWVEDIVSYSNSVLPWAFFTAYRILGDQKFLTAAEETMKFLANITFKENMFKPVGCKGWYEKDGTAAKFDEQPIEACETMLAYLEAYRVTGKKKYKQQAQRCRAWYEGKNSKGVSLIDNETGGCFDGLTEKGINENFGSESLISYMISYLTILDGG